jgi:cysteine-S-conjugate beta-lyase
MVFDGQRYSAAQVDAFVDALQRFSIGYSWGGPMSLVMPYGVRGMRSTGAFAQAHASGDTLVRLAIGLESVDDLLADLAQAFLQLPKA